MKSRVSILFVAVLMCICKSSWALAPTKEYKSTPAKLKMKYEEQRIQTPDGASLLAWYFPSPRITNKMILVSHNGVGNMGENLARIKSLISFGFNVLCYDYRGFGQSSEFGIDDDTYIYTEFYDDFKTVYDFAVENYNRRLYLYGWGIGATIGNTVGFDLPNTNTIISDGSINKFSDMPDRFKKIGSRMHIDQDVISNYKDPYTIFANTPGANLRAILLMMGSHDYLLSKEDMSMLSERSQSVYIQVYTMDNKRSWDNYRHNPSLYMKVIHQFLVNN
ncbi:MAG: alpha/beta hydrolase [Cyclobacteriaceae bacterium]